MVYFNYTIKKYSLYKIWIYFFNLFNKKNSGISLLRRMINGYWLKNIGKTLIFFSLSYKIEKEFQHI